MFLPDDVVRVVALSEKVIAWVTLGFDPLSPNLLWPYSVRTDSPTVKCCKNLIVSLRQII
jgi:hypothetical protein